MSLEETGANTQTAKQFIYDTYTELLQNVEPKPGKTKTETYEDQATALFKKQPANMRLLIVVDKLLTGFSASHCTYLYIDKSMQDHGLFQAICRTNRLDGDDKDFGYIVDYKDLFKKLENAISVYSSELDDSAGGASPDVLVQDRLKKGKERLDNAIEALDLLCEPVERPKGELQHMHYFCGNVEIPSDLQEREPRRAALYKGIVAFVRAYANIADELREAGYSDDRNATIRQLLDRYVKLRDVIRQAAGETLDLKSYEADMRHLIDAYIEADEPRKISPFDNIGLVDLIVKTGIADAIAARLGGLKGNKDAIAETIENNVRSTIIRKQMSDPAFYAKMSQLLDEVIADRKAKALAYEQLLLAYSRIIKLMEAGKTDDTPKKLDSPGKRAIYNVLNELAASPAGTEQVIETDETYHVGDEDQTADRAVAIHETILADRPDAWRGVQAREAVIKQAIHRLVPNVDHVERIFTIITAQREY